MTDAKMTQKEMYAHIAEAMVEDEAVVEFCKNKIAQLEKRAAAPRKPRFNAAANDFALVVIDTLRAADGPMTNKEIVEMVNEAGVWDEPVSAQKVSAALRKIAAGAVVDGDKNPVAVELVITEGEKASDPKTFAL